MRTIASSLARGHPPFRENRGVERAEVVVVGLGAMGSAAARSLGRRGVRTIGLERFEVGHARGSSHGPTRIFRLSYPDPDYVRLAVRALDLWRELEHDADETLLVTTGGLDAGPMAQACSESLDTIGVSNEWLSPDEAEKRFSGISAADLDGLLFQADAGGCLPQRTVAAQGRLAGADGVDLREGVEVLALRPHGDGVAVDTSAGPVEAGGGAGTPRARGRPALPAG